MNIGIIGSGNIGGTLGQHFARVGHGVLFSSRHPEQLRSLAEAAGAQAGTVEEAARFGEVVLLAVPFGENAEVAEQAGPLGGTILIDATNPYSERDGDVARAVIEDDGRTSTGYTAQCFPAARVVKAFNSIYYKVLQEKAFREGDARIGVQIAGDDADAKRTVAGLIEEIGFAPQDLGSLAEGGPHFEPDAPLYNKNLPIREAEALYAEQASR